MIKVVHVFYFTFVLFLVLALSGAAEAQLEEPIIPDFVAEPISGPAPLSVLFSDTTDYGIDFDPEIMDVSFSWDFGDGQTADSTIPDLSHVYEEAGIYDVTLTVTVTEDGETLAVESETKTEYIEVLSGTVEDEFPVMNFTAEPLSGNVPLTVNFTDTSDFGPDFDPDTAEVTRFWDFGDGNSTNSTEITGSYTYGTPGTYDVTLTLFYTEGNETLNKSLTKEAYIEVLEEEPVSEYPKLDFTAYPRSGYAPLSVNFTPLADFGPDFDMGNVTVEGIWDFGDGSNSTEMNATHIYADPGIYNVTASISILEGGETIASVSTTKEQYIRVFDPEAPGIGIFPGWTFISVPYALENASVDYIFADLNYESVIYYDAADGIWTDAADLEPLKGYWVKSPDFGLIPLERLERKNSDPQVPGASIPIYEGWNAIGFTDSTETLSAEFTLAGIDASYFEIIGPWDPLDASYTYIGRNGLEGELQGKYVGTDVFMMEPYQGYWILATENTTLYAVGW
ncbi:PKD domain-containing protein [Methanosarcina sp. KYL-1]|uniref:PKD domain-containing protein n=1 Tax=Methanosarcina sp. KYL-1 TaxID=2602068 RepID=UPI0021016A26|nr:PKD domain-containing protein [Methanosarcina sp. KYL-1]MCQ1534483.1 PKD domain-containing protein [Methanosarcina sp. KYL-1]